MAQRGPLCLGIDPHPELLTAWGLPVSADGVAKFSDICVEAFAGFAIVKPQVAFFEAYGSAGFAVLERTIVGLQEAGVLVLADAKRGDIGSTMAAYAQAWAGDSPLAADAVTASPYLGFGSLQPLLDVAAAHGRGVFVLAATSNPEGASVQRALAGERTVAQTIVDEVAGVNAAADGSVGVVVGATLTEVPIIQGLLASGMGKGPALALLLAGPSLSLPNMLVIRGVLGTKKTVVYVALVIVMATLSGFLFGNLF